ASCSASSSVSRRLPCRAAARVEQAHARLAFTDDPELEARASGGVVEREARDALRQRHETRARAARFVREHEHRRLVLHAERDARRPRQIPKAQRELPVAVARAELRTDATGEIPDHELLRSTTRPRVPPAATVASPTAPTANTVATRRQRR